MLQPDIETDAQADGRQRWEELGPPPSYNLFAVRETPQVSTGFLHDPPHGPQKARNSKLNG